MANKKKRNDWNGPILILLALIYGGLLILFGVQTWFFVNWLFPTDQLLMKCLTMLCFDVLALVWAVAHTFYRFRSRGAKRWVQIAWAVTFILSLVASILYLVIQSFFRFRIAPDINYIYTGYSVSILALVFNILALMFVLIYEYRAANPRQDYFEDDEEDETQRTAQASPLADPPLTTASQSNGANGHK